MRSYDKAAFAVGDKVIVRTNTDAYRFDIIERETNTRWVCETGQWFDKEHGRGAKPGSAFSFRYELIRADDIVALRTMHQDALKSAVLLLDKTVRAERIVNIDATRRAFTRVEKALAALIAVSDS